jgi:rSAM/selenodomain-associated transferase 2
VCEVIVIDGGSVDGTAEAARRAGARVVDSEPGRGRQLDLGWRSARAGVVLFLHADSVLPRGWRQAVERALEEPSVAGGAFRLGFEERGLRWRLLELGVRLRVNLLKLPYGDQALFVRRTVLEASGGVPHVEILEDLDLVRAIRRSGRLELLPEIVRTSGRRHRSHGLVHTITRHALALVGFYLGLDRAWIAQKVRG